MNNKPQWLPELVLFADYDGEWEPYLEALYSCFRKDFIETKPFFIGQRIGLKRYPLERGKEATFWHLISEGFNETERLPDFKRCERIRWPSPIIEHADENVIKVWRNKRRSEKRILLWLEKLEYLVVLAERKGYILPWTAYIVKEEHKKRKLLKEYETYKKADAAQ